MQFEDAGTKGTFAEEGKIVDEEVDSKKKWNLRKKDLLNQLRYIQRMSGYVAQGMLKETWQQELQDVEQRRSDLLLEHQKDAEDTKADCRAYKTKKGAVPEGFGKWAGDSER